MMQTMKEEKYLILAKVKELECKILRGMETSENRYAPPVEQRDDNSTPTHSNQSINKTSNDTVQLKILKLLKEMREENSELRKRRKKNPKNNDYNSNNNPNNNNANNNNNNIINNNNNNSNNNSGRYYNNNNNNNNNWKYNRKNNNNNHNRNINRNQNNNNNSINNYNRNTGYVRDASHYYSTHGACGHDGKDCFKPGNNHNNNATFNNKMGGSTAY